MKVGISPNYLKAEIFNFIDAFVKKLEKAEIDFIFSEAVLKIKNCENGYWNNFNIFKDEELAGQCDVVVSIGGDGTLLQTAYYSRKYQTPLLGAACLCHLGNGRRWTGGTHEPVRSPGLSVLAGYAALRSPSPPTPTRAPSLVLRFQQLRHPVIAVLPCSLRHYVMATPTLLYTQSSRAHRQR